VEAALASIVAAATPLVFAAVGETITERSGVVNLGLEGSLMLSAMTGFAAAVVTESTILGFVAAALVSMALAGVVAFAAIRLGVGQIAVGFVLTLLAVDLSDYLGAPYVGVQGPGVPQLSIPVLSEIPLIGPVLFSQNIVVYASYLVLIGASLFLYRTRTGLALRGVGERPEAAFARGVPVTRTRVLATLAGGALVGVAGAAFSLDVKLGWREGLTANFGWIALAIVIFGGWNPVRAAFGAYLFGVLQVVSLRLQPVLPGLSQVLPLLPFPLMILTLVLVNRPWLRRLTERNQALRFLVAGPAPSGLGRPFRPD
jgi:general nucleoside transport system permease protein